MVLYRSMSLPGDERDSSPLVFPGRLGAYYETLVRRIEGNTVADEHGFDMGRR